MSILQRLGFSLQTELLILAILGMANSTLNWKPFELMVRLNVIRDISFENIQISEKFASSIRKLLTASVVVEFFCSLLNPLAYLLKLYPIITMSRSDVLLPWLVIHAINSLVPKILSFGLVCVLYSENIISLLFLLEFVFVESVNILFAGYNWYIFFEFYSNLRELEQHGSMCKNQGEVEMTGSSVLPKTHSRSPTVTASVSESSIGFKKSKDSRVVRSLSSVDSESQETDITMENSVSSLFSEDNLSSAEKTANSFSGEVKGARKPEKTRGLSPPSISFDGNSYISSYIKSEYRHLSTFEVASKVWDPIKEHFEESIEKQESLDNFLNKCTCSSSESEEEVNELSKKFHNSLWKQEKGIKVTASRLSKKFSRKSKKSLREPLVLSPSVSRTLNPKNFHKRNATLHIILDKNFQFLNRMCNALSVKNENMFKNSNQKWLIFRHKLEATLDDNVFLKESNSFIDVNKFQIESKRKSRETVAIVLSDSKTKTNDKSKNAKEMFNEKNKFNQKNTIGINDALSNKEKQVLSEVGASYFVEFNKFSQLDSTKQRKFIPSHPIIMGNSENQLLDYSKCDKSNNFVLKPSRTTDTERTRELRNLQAYNNLTLVLDRREMLQKKNKSKMTSYKKVVGKARGKMKMHKSAVTFDANSEKTSVQTDLRNSPERIEKIGIDNESVVTVEAIPTELLVPNCSKIQPISKSMRETIAKIDWSNPVCQHSSPVTSEKRQVGPRSEDGSDRRVIADDETLSLLQSAFSYSDESERSFHLGPDASEPYPIFQVFALSMAEMFKSTSWRDFERALASSDEIEIPALDDGVFYGATEERGEEMAREKVPGDADLDADSIDNGNKHDEMERQSIVSACLLEQLQELLESSRETLSVVEKLRLARLDEGEGEGTSDKDVGTLEYLTAMKDFFNQEGKLRNDIRTLNTYLCTINGKECSGCDDGGDGGDPEGAVEDDEENRACTQSERKNYRTRCSRMYEVGLASTAQMHHQREGEGLSSGNVMEFNSEGHVLSSMKSHNSSYDLRFNSDKAEVSTCRVGDANNSVDAPKDKSSEKGSYEILRASIVGSDDYLVGRFDSFYRKIVNQLELDANDAEFRRKIGKLVTTENFTKFMSLVKDKEVKIIELNNSDIVSDACALNDKSYDSEKAEIDKNNKTVQELELCSKNYINVPLREKMKKRETTVIRSHSQELLENYREQLDSDIIRERIANWNRDSIESLDVFAERELKSRKNNTISVSDGSDMEEFPAD